MSVQSRIFWLILLIEHALGAAAWWWYMPGGFPPTHPRFWINQVFPLVLVALVVFVLWRARRKHLDSARVLIGGLSMMWLAAAVAAHFIFPRDRQILWGAMFASAIVLAIAAYGPAMKSVRWPRWTPAALVVGAAIGVLLPFSQRAPLASTRPLNDIPDLTPAHTIGPTTQSRILSLGDGWRIQPDVGEITLQRGKIVFAIQPLLTFISCSGDRGWASLAKPLDRVRRRWLEDTFLAGKSEIVTYYKHDDGDALIDASRRPDESTLFVDALTRLDHDVYSHLNTFCQFSIAGHRKLSVSFSPCPDTRIDVLPSDYPVGRPARFAYVDAAHQFHIVEARSAEKGPFHDLARGSVTESDKMTITLHDDDRAILSVTLEDWIAQLSTAPSPTAGWGVPVNAIEFSLEGGALDSPANFYITLAGTSVGRGWDSVGHAAGLYRNRIVIRPLIAGELSK